MAKDTVESAIIKTKKPYSLIKKTFSSALQDTFKTADNRAAEMKHSGRQSFERCQRRCGSLLKVDLITRFKDWTTGNKSEMHIKRCRVNPALES